MRHFNGQTIDNAIAVPSGDAGLIARQELLNEMFGKEEVNWTIVEATASLLYNNKQDYSPKLVNEAAVALNVEPFETLMEPELAMALRRQLEAATIFARDEGLLTSPRAGVSI